MGKTGKSKIFKVSVIVLMSLVMLLIVKTTGLFQEARHQDSPSYNTLAGDTLDFVILIDSKLNTGSPSLKFANDMIRRFGELQNYEVNVSIERPSEIIWENLVNKRSDVVLFNSKDSISPLYTDYLAVSVTLEDGYVCAMRYDDEMLMKNINYWITHFKATSEYKQLIERLHRRDRERGSRYVLPISRYSISQYDHLVKKYSATIGWDWRLLSALMYQESKFNNGVVSRRGAIGLMQIKESTALKAGITNVYDPEQNIKAGVKELGRLIRKYTKAGIEEPELTRFVLAAYNAGEGRIKQMMDVAKAEGKNNKNWEELISVLPLMKDGYDKNGITAAPYLGQEMIKHVEFIEKQFDFYKRTVD
ncbi:MAG: transglycosylase SLT domain-containing protein [Candidatus Egerieousia sp.]